MFLNFTIGKVWCTPTRARWIVLAVCAAAAIITFPEFFEFRTIYTTNQATNQTILKPIRTDFGKQESYQWGYVYTNQALFTFIPLGCLFVFNTLLVRAVLAAARQRKDMSGRTTKDQLSKQGSEQHKITIMLITVVVVFLFCQLPQAVLNMYVTYLTVTDGLRKHRIIIITIIGNVFNLLVIINSSVNYILYSAFSNRFRATFNKLFCRCLLNKPTDHLFSDASKTKLIADKSSKSNGTQSTQLKTTLLTGKNKGNDDASAV